MPDPRANIVAPKPCPPEYLGKSAAGIAKSSSDRRDFANAVGKVGDLEILNSVGAGKVGQGLRTIASVSNSIRQGCGALPTSIGSAIGSGMDAGVEWVMNNVGMTRSVIEAVNQFSPAIANQALGQAQQIFQQAKQGNFKLTDIPGALQDLQNLERLGRNIFTPGAGDRNSGLSTQCEASPYAIDLIARAPKHKFMFIVQFVPASGYESLVTNDIAFVVYESSRPNIRYQMEDINFYNFRSKVITKTEFEPMSMKFYDDITNDAGRFHAAVLKALTPIANIPTYSGFYSPEERGTVYDVQGGTIGGVDFSGRYSTSSYGPLNDIPGTETGNIVLFQEIRLFHLFEAGRKMNIYSFYNPRISELKLDELTMEGDAKTSVELNFAYDTVYIDTDVSFRDGQLSRSAQVASSGGGSAVYSLKYIDSAGAATGPNNAGLAAQQTTPAPASTTCGTDIKTTNPT
jgi:hypothetical protein